MNAERDIRDILAWADSSLGVVVTREGERYGFALRAGERSAQPLWASVSGALLAGVRAALGGVLAEAYAGEGALLEALADGGLFLVPADPEAREWAYRWPEEGLAGSGYASAGAAATAALVELRARPQPIPAGPRGGSYQTAQAA